jgi:integrase
VVLIFQVVRLVPLSSVERMAGHIRKIDQDKWFVRISAGKHPITGKRIQKSRVVHGVRRDAEKALHDLRSQEYAGLLVSSHATLDEIVTAWIKSPTKGGRKRSATTAYHDWNRYKRYVQPTMGSVKADNLRPIDFVLLYDALVDFAELSPRSVLHIHSLLRASMNWGLDRQLITSNPMTSVKPHSVPLSPPQAPDTKVVLRHLEILKESNPDLWVAVFLAGTMGLRRSEIAGLRWSHIDFDDKTLKICEGIVKVPGHGSITTGTKTGLHGFARFDLHPTSLDALIIRYSEFGQRLLALEITDHSDGYLFSSELLCQQPIDPDLLTKWLRKHCASHPEVEPITFQSLRKFTSSALEGGGVDETTASALLRDRPETVSRHYRAAHAARVRIATLQLGDLLTPQPA